MRTRETAEHFLLHCSRFHEARNKLTDTLKEISGKVFRIGTVRNNWPMSAHASQAFSIAHCTDSEDLPISELSGHKKLLQPSETLLLAPFSDDVTKKDDKLIKEALFQFISATKVKT